MDSGSRTLAMCGDISIGATFTSAGRRTRWRMWVTKNMNPVQQTAANDTKAKAEIERRFEEFLQLAKLQPVPQLGRGERAAD
jgi:hypothetical protein